MTVPGARGRILPATTPASAEVTLSPTILIEGGFRLYFFSREEARIHVHVAHADGEAKFWLTPSVQVASVVGMSPRRVREAEAIVHHHLLEIRHAWEQHFGR